jgi:hypothetical protein
MLEESTDGFASIAIASIESQDCTIQLGQVAYIRET